MIEREDERTNEREDETMNERGGNRKKSMKWLCWPGPTVMACTPIPVMSP